MAGMAATSPTLLFLPWPRASEAPAFAIAAAGTLREGRGHGLRQYPEQSGEEDPPPVADHLPGSTSEPVTNPSPPLSGAAVRNFQVKGTNTNGEVTLYNRRWGEFKVSFPVGGGPVIFPPKPDDMPEEDYQNMAMAWYRGRSRRSTYTTVGSRSTTQTSSAKYEDACPRGRYRSSAAFVAAGDLPGSSLDLPLQPANRPQHDDQDRLTEWYRGGRGRTPRRRV